MEASQSTKYRATIWSSSSTPEYILGKKKMKILIQKVMCTPVLIAALFIIAKVYK